MIFTEKNKRYLKMYRSMVRYLRSLKERETTLKSKIDYNNNITNVRTKSTYNANYDKENLLDLQAKIENIKQDITVRRRTAVKILRESPITKEILYSFATCYYIDGMSIEETSDIIYRNIRTCERYKAELEGEKNES